MYQTIEKHEELADKILADAIKSLDMTDKQIVTACRPKPQYYSTMTKTARRTCLWCRWNTEGRYQTHTETICQLETHYMENH